MPSKKVPGPLLLGEPPDISTDQEIQKYEQGSELGKGSQARVYEYRHGTQLVAAKVIKFDPGEWFSKAAEEKQNQRILQEARISLQTNHPHLLRAHQCIKCGDAGLVILMPLYRYGTLAYIKANESFTQEQKRETMIQVLDGLHALHMEKTLHRDIKPQNILVKDLCPLHLVISDFGISSISNPITAIGSSWYRAPELRQEFDALHNTRHGAPVDIFSAGILLIWILGPCVPSDRLEPLGSIMNPQHIKKCIFEFFDQAFTDHPTGNIRDALEMAQQMMKCKPEERPSAYQCLTFSWPTSSRYMVKDPEGQTRHPAIQRSIVLDIKDELLKEDGKRKRRSSRYPPCRFYNETFLSKQEPSPNRVPYSSSCLIQVR